MAGTKSQGSSTNGRDSCPQYLGVKVYGGQAVLSGGIIIRQRGTKFRPGRFVKRAKDDSLFAIRSGVVKFRANRLVDVIPN